MKLRNLFMILGFVAIICVVVALMVLNSQSREIQYSDFVVKVQDGMVEEVYANKYQAKIRLHGSETNEREFPSKSDATVIVPSYDALRQIIEENNNAKRLYDAAVKAGKTENNMTEEELNGAGRRFINLTFTDPNAGSFFSSILPILSFLVLILFAYIMYRSISGSNKQAMNFSKSKARLNSNIKVRFSDVAGAEEEKTELQEVVEFLKNPKKFEIVGARIPKGVLLVGLPGTGKTLFAKAVAGEANVPFFSISGSDFVEMFVGVGASRVRELFEDAKKNMPCIIFIDEIDAVGRQRGTGLGGGHDEREQTLNQLLVQMDGFETNSGIIVMAATNRADILDPALLRPGRFDRQVYVHMPDVRGREEIFRVHSRNKPLSGDVDFKVLGKMTSGFSGADIENLLNEAAILAARDNRNVINMLDINEGINKVVMGPQKKSRIVTEVDKRITAYHEAGHAIVARKLKHCDPVHEVSIIPRGHAAGYTMMRPDTDDNHVTFNKLNDDIAMTMGGRAAEEIVLKDISTGASGDIRQATEKARKMVTEWGMSKSLGPVFLGSEGEVFLGRDYQSTYNYSEAVAAVIDKEVRSIVETGHQTALKILNDNREIMDKMVRLLIEKETIYSEEVDALMEGKELKEIEAAMEKRLSERAASLKSKEVPH